MWISTWISIWDIIMNIKCLLQYKHRFCKTLIIYEVISIFDFSLSTFCHPSAEYGSSAKEEKKRIRAPVLSGSNTSPLVHSWSKLRETARSFKRMEFLNDSERSRTSSHILSFLFQIDVIKRSRNKVQNTCWRWCNNYHLTRTDRLCNDLGKNSSINNPTRASSLTTLKRVTFF